MRLWQLGETAEAGKSGKDLEGVVVQDGTCMHSQPLRTTMLLMT